MFSDSHSDFWKYSKNEFQKTHFSLIFVLFTWSHQQILRNNCKWPIFWKIIAYYINISHHICFFLKKSALLRLSVGAPLCLRVTCLISDLSMIHVLGPVFHGESNGNIFSWVTTMQICIICKYLQKSPIFCTFLHISPWKCHFWRWEKSP